MDHSRSCWMPETPEASATGTKSLVSGLRGWEGWTWVGVGGGVPGLKLPFWGGGWIAKLVRAQGSPEQDREPGLLGPCGEGAKCKLDLGLLRISGRREGAPPPPPPPCSLGPEDAGQVEVLRNQKSPISMTLNSGLLSLLPLALIPRGFSVIQREGLQLRIPLPAHHLESLPNPGLGMKWRGRGRVRSQSPLLSRAPHGPLS